MENLCSRCEVNPRHPKHTAYCRECLTELAKARRDRIRGGPAFTPMTPEEKRVYKLGYAKRWNKNNPEKRRAANRQWRVANREKVNAQKKAAYWRDKALLAGEAIPPCELCGAASTHMHHEDYAEPRKVRWLCARCHRRVHTGALCLE